ncbi:MAG: hypothetical protein ACRCTA_00255 [Bacilli bacterium]
MNLKSELGKQVKALNNYILTIRQTDAPVGIQCNAKTTREPGFKECEASYILQGNGTRIKYCK